MDTATARAISFAGNPTDTASCARIESVSLRVSATCLHSQQVLHHRVRGNGFGELLQPVMELTETHHRLLDQHAFGHELDVGASPLVHTLRDHVLRRHVTVVVLRCHCVLPYGILMTVPGISTSGFAMMS